MNITQKTQTQIDLDTLENRIQRATNSLSFAASQLNTAYDAVWKLPEDRQLALLQSILDSGNFATVFGVHAKAAAYINELLVDAGSTPTAKVGTPREIEIVDGTISFIQPVVEEDIDVDGE